MEQVSAQIITNEQVLPDIYLTWLECPEITTNAKPGQFIMVHCGEETVLRRPISIHQVEGSKLAILFTVIGKGTELLSQYQPGEHVDIIGSLGNGFTVSENSKNLLLIAGGMGIAPLY